MEREKNFKKTILVWKNTKMVHTWTLKPKFTGQEVIWEEFEETVNMVFCLAAWLFLSIEENCQNVEKHGNSLCGEENVNLSHTLLGWIQILFFKTTEGLTKVSSWVSDHCLNLVEHIPSKEFLWDRWQVIVPSLHKQETCNVLLRAEAKNAKQQWDPESVSTQTSTTATRWADCYGWRALLWL